MNGNIRDKAVWFVIGAVITAILATIAALSWLEGFVDQRITTMNQSKPPNIAAPEFDKNPEELVLPGQITFGSWREPAQCKPGYYVCGGKQRTEGDRGKTRDDTGMNGLILLCCQFEPTQ